MYQTTFPQPEGGLDNNSPNQGGWQGGQQGYQQPYQQQQPQPYQQSQGNDQGYQKKPWQNNQGGQGGQGGYQKKPWQSGGDGKKWERPKETDLSFYKPVAMTGNQDTPPQIMEKMVEIAKTLEANGYTVRVGGLDGIEDTIEKALTKPEVHLPFKDFNQKQSKFTYVSDRAMAVAKLFFPNWDAMKKGVQYFLAKNARILMGQRVDSPALFLVCWTDDGVESIKDRTNRTGFTGHPIAIASALGIPIFNLGNTLAEQRLMMYLESVNNGKES